MIIHQVHGRRKRRFLLILVLACVLTGLLGACSAPSLPAASRQAPPAATLASEAAPAVARVPPDTPAVALTVLPTEAPAPATAAPLAPAEPIAIATTEVPPTALATQPLRLALEPVVQARRPIFLTHAGDDTGRLFVVEKPGVIRILEKGRLSDTPFLDIRDRVNGEGSEQGLLGLAFAPNFTETGHFFVNYTDARGDTVISRFRAAPDGVTADPGSEFTVLEIDQPAPNHNGGNLVFGPDGYLWIGTGDGGAANDRFGNGQNPKTLLGKMLRIDVTTDPGRPYLVPADNPWTKNDWNGRDVRDEVWAVGLRNPWRYSFDRATGDLWIGDVGQNQYEEVNRVRAGSAGGLNFGWPIMEGRHCFPDDDNCDRTGLENPVTDYSHQGHCSITGGYVYRGSALPGLAGTYVFGDFCSGVIWGLSQVDGQWQERVLLDSDLSISSFGEDAAGELYVLDLNSGGIFRFAAE